MIDREATKLFHGLSRREKAKKVLAAAAGVCAAAAFGYFGFFYEGWLPFPGANNVFFINHGEFVKDQWIYQNNTPLLHTDQDGRRVIGLYDTEDGTYLFDENGRKMTGLQSMADGTRYFDEDGRMVQGWLTMDGEEYYFAADGTRSTGWLLNEGDWYWLRADGSRYEGWGRINGERYYFHPADGKMQTGWLRDGKDWYLLSATGKMLTGDQEEDGRLYYLEEDGTRYSGWRTCKDGRRYYGDIDGHALVGWNEVDDNLMYFGETGIMQTGRIELDGDSFYLEDDGTISPGWHEIENGIEDVERFYVCRDGFILQTDKETGNSGRLVIHDCGIDVALNKARSRDDYQSITDAEDSALVVKERRDVESVIADRRSQGFDIAEAVEEKSYAYIVDSKGQITEYVCTNSSLGHNTGEDVVDKENKSVWKQNAGGFCTYTSAGNGEAGAVRIVFWQPV